jgi:hypothetical protein
MRRSITQGLLIGFTSLLACVDPFQTAIHEEGERYVVEGEITNQNGPFKLQITRTANYSRKLDGITTYVSGAQAQVCDDEGNCFPYFEVEKGRYQTAVNTIQPEPGKSYHLEISLPDGSRIRSHDEKMLPSPDITEAYFEFDPSTLQSDGFQIYVDVNDPAGQRNYYKWETSAYYPYSTYCFSVDQERSIDNIASDQNINGNVLSRKHITAVPFNSTTFSVVEVYQLALTPNAYEFLSAIKKQVQSSGSIFDPPPSFIRGNLYNPDDENDEVLGYFIVAGTSQKDVVIDRSKTGLFPDYYTELEKEPLYCGDPCNLLCVSFGGGKCGVRPCPPDCAYLPGKTNIAPKSWPLNHHPCGE